MDRQNELQMFNIGRDGLMKACTAQPELLEHLQDCFW